MEDFKAISRQITTALELEFAPVAISFTNELPSGVSEFTDRVPAGCEFWEKARNSIFATTADHHALCSIGIHTHNIAGAPESQMSELTTTLKTMASLEYVQEKEVATIPVINQPTQYVVYGPLSETPMTCDAVVLFVDSFQGLILSEAIARVDESIPLAMGRPACALIPQVINSNKGANSGGCCGARAYLETLTPDTTLWALPGNKLAAYAEQIEKLAKANAALTQFHEVRKADVEKGMSPTAQESLERMQA